MSKWSEIRSFKTKLAQMGFSSYEQYLKSSHWKQFKARYKKSSEVPHRCLICRYSRIQLHHRTYKRLGAERLEDVVPLCDEHHEAVHRLLKENRKNVTKTDWAIRVLRGELNVENTSVPLSSKPAPTRTSRKRKKERRKTWHIKEKVRKEYERMRLADRLSTNPLYPDADLDIGG